MLFFFILCKPSIINLCYRTGRCHGVALWMEYHLTDDITVSTGLIGPVSEQVSQPSPPTLCCCAFTSNSAISPADFFSIVSGYTEELVSILEL